MPCAKKKIISRYGHDNLIGKKNNTLFLSLDCSGFLFYYLWQAYYTRALNEVRQSIAEQKNLPLSVLKRPYISEYIHHLSTNKLLFWHPVLHPNLLQEGDIILFKGRSAGTNHCMIIKQQVSSKTQSVIQVVDSTQIPHRNDTRRAGQTGLGTGEISLLPDSTGKWCVYQNKGHPITLDIYLARVRT